MFELNRDLGDSRDRLMIAFAVCVLINILWLYNCHTMFRLWQFVHKGKPTYIQKSPMTKRYNM